MTNSRLLAANLVVQLLTTIKGEWPPGVSSILAAVWRAALGNVASGMAFEVARASLIWIFEAM